MSCRDRAGWTALLAHRFGPALEEPPEWPLALAHLEHCPDCARLALSLDPTLVFQRLPQPAPAPGDIDAMRAAVASLRRASALQAAPAARAQGAARAWRVAAAAILALTLASQLPLARHPAAARLPQSAVASSAGSSGIALARFAAARRMTTGRADGLLVPGEVGRPQARVYEIGYPEMAVVMVVDKSLGL